MSQIVERIGQFIKVKGISIRSFEQSIGASNGSIGRAIANGSDISSSWVSKIIDKYPEINTNWLITGIGEMRNSSKPISIDHQFNLRTDRNIDAQDIPLYDFDATAGLVAIFNSHNIEPEDYLHIPNLPPVDGAIYVRGESMSPLLKSGDIVMYKKKELSMDSIFWGDIYLLSFIYDGDSYTAVKYIQKSNEPDKIRLVSFNPSFAPKDIPMNCVTALALVKASLTFHTME